MHSLSAFYKLAISDLNITGADSYTALYEIPLNSSVANCSDNGTAVCEIKFYP